MIQVPKKQQKFQFPKLQQQQKQKKAAQLVGTVVPACSSRIWDADTEEHHELKLSLIYIAVTRPDSTSENKQKNISGSQTF